MADATAVIAQLGQQIAQLVVDKTITLVELTEARERIAALEGEKTCEPVVKP